MAHINLLLTAGICVFTILSLIASIMVRSTVDVFFMWFLFIFIITGQTELSTNILAFKYLLINTISMHLNKTFCESIVEVVALCTQVN